MKLLRSAPTNAGPRAADLSTRVLYVEDDPENWAVAQLRLGRHFDLVWARNDADACSEIHRSGRALAAILMDIELRGSRLSGIDLTRLLRGESLPRPVPDYAQQLPKLEIPVMFVTAYRARYSEDELKQAGAQRLISKPVNFAELSTALSSLVLSTRPQLADQFVEAATRQADVDALTRLAAQDEAFSRRLSELLRLTSGGEAASSLDEALRVAGPAAAADAARFLSLVALAGEDPAVQPVLENVLRRAAVAWLLSPRIDPSMAPTCALVLGAALDAGLLLRARHDPLGALEVARMPARHRAAREQAGSELVHTERSAVLARELGLSTELLAAVQRHHDAAPPTDAPARLAWLTERAAAVFEAGAPAQNRLEALAAAQKVEVDGAALGHAVAELPDRLAALARALGRVVRPPSFDQLAGASQAQLEALNQSYDELVQALAALSSEKDVLVEKLTKANEQLAKNAGTDELTGIANHRAFREAFKRDLAQADRNELPLSLVMVDVDHFKRINDTHGHPAGDAVLRHVAGVLTGGLRGTDFVARYGGEEFAILLPKTDPPTARMVAERLRAALEKTHVHVRGQDIAVTASFGVSSLQPPFHGGIAGEGLLKAADDALYRAKAAGRNRVELAEPNKS